MIGFATDITDQEDENGITWHRSQGTIQYLMGSLFRHPFTEVIELDSADKKNAGDNLPWKVSSLPSQEELAFRSLSNEKINKTNVSGVIDVMQSSYERF